MINNYDGIEWFYCPNCRRYMKIRVTTCDDHYCPFCGYEWKVNKHEVKNDY